MIKTIIRETTITVLLALLLFVAIRSVAHSAEVSGYSMEPSLHDGQRIIVSKVAYWFGDPQRGDIVVFDTDRISNDIIHRIVGLPGELIEIKHGKLFINGKEMDEPYLQGSSIDTPPQQIPDDRYFIVGDNRGSASSDLVSRNDIIGKAWLCYWPVSEWGTAPNYSW